MPTSPEIHGKTSRLFGPIKIIYKILFVTLQMWGMLLLSKSLRTLWIEGIFHFSTLFMILFFNDS